MRGIDPISERFIGLFCGIITMVLVSACQPIGSMTTKNNPASDQIKITLRIAPETFAWEKIGEVTVTLGAENLGKRTRETHLNQCKLYVNEKASFAWSLTLGNGLRPDKWYHLPGHDSVEITWKHLANGLFPEPGTYDLRLELEGETIQEMRVLVK